MKYGEESFLSLPTYAGSAVLTDIGHSVRIVYHSKKPKKENILHVQLVHLKMGSGYWALLKLREKQEDPDIRPPSLIGSIMWV